MIAILTSIVESTIQNIIAAIVLNMLGRFASLCFRSYKSKFTGLWQARIYDGSILVKQDSMKILHNAHSNHFRGWVKRTYPADLYKNRSWGVEGVLTTNKIECTYWTEQEVGSIFTASLHRVGENKYSGFYYKDGLEPGTRIATKIEIYLVNKLTIWDKIILTFHKSCAPNSPTTYSY